MNFKNVISSMVISLAASASLASTVIMHETTPTGPNSSKNEVVLSEEISEVIVFGEKNDIGNYEVRVRSKNSECALRFKDLSSAISTYSAIYNQLPNPKAVVNCGFQKDKIVHNRGFFSRSTDEFSLALYSVAPDHTL